MKKWAKSIIIYVVLFVFISTFMLTGCGQNSDTQQTTSADTTSAAPTATEAWQKPTDRSGGIALPLVKEPLEYEALVPSNPTWPFDDYFLVFETLEKMTNIKINWQTVSSNNYGDKVSILLASGSIPDIMPMIKTDTLNEYGKKGLFLNVWKYIDIMPNFQKVLADNPDINSLKISDDELYLVLNGGFVEKENMDSMLALIPIMRTDVLESLGLNEPKTYDELYNIFVKLKQTYPDSVPWINRQGVDVLLRAMGPQWGINFSNPYDGSLKSWFELNEKSGSYEIAIDNSSFKAMIEFITKCYRERLLHQEFANYSSQQWEASVVTGKGFFAFDWFARPQRHTNEMRAKGDNTFKFEAIMPPSSLDGKNVVMSRASLAPSGAGISSKVKNPEVFMKWVDLLYYSLEGSLLTRLGVEGVTYENKGNNSYAYIKTEETTVPRDFTAKYGVMYDGYVGMNLDFFNYKYIDVFASDFYLKQCELYKNHYIMPPRPLVFVDSEKDIIKEVGVPLDQYITAELTKFIMGIKKLDEWDAFANEVKNRGSDQIKKVYNDAKARLK